MNKTHLFVLIFFIISVSFMAKGCSLLPKTSLAILSYQLEKSTDGEEGLSAKIVGVALNDGSARLEYAEIEGYFYSEDATLLATGFAKTIKEGEFFTLDPGQLWNFTILYPESLTDEPAEEVDEVSVKVGTLIGSTLMP